MLMVVSARQMEQMKEYITALHAQKKYITALHAQFGEEMYGDPILEMKNLRQEGTLTEYFCKFDVPLSKVDHLEPASERATLSPFVGGLDQSLQGPVRLL